jgi:beta-lactamase class A
MRTVTVLVFCALTAWVAIAIVEALGDAEPDPPRVEPPAAGAEPGAAPRAPGRARAHDRRPARVPTAAAIRDAGLYARGREGAVSFAVLNSQGKLRGRTVDRLYSAASTVKAMLLAAEVERLERESLPLDSETDSLLEAMITYSDNDAADSIYPRVGDAGMFAVARSAGMTEFTEAGHWGNAQISAADLARFYSRLDELMAGPHREYALGLLGSVTPDQSWGIPAAARPEWAVRFKGGWLPERGLVHQAGELRDGERLLSIAVLTDAQPSFEYGTETVRGIAERLLSSRNDGA